MSRISITREHHFSHEEAISHIEQLAEKLVQKYGGSYQWQGDDLVYEYSGGLTAKVSCTEDDVSVDIKLGMLMAMLKSTISKEVEGYMDKYFCSPAG